MKENMKKMRLRLNYMQNIYMQLKSNREDGRSKRRKGLIVK